MVKQVHALAIVAWFVVGHGVLKVISLRGGNIAQGITSTADQAENIKTQHRLPVVGTLEPLSAYKDIRGGIAALLMQKSLSNEAGKVCSVFQVSDVYGIGGFSLNERPWEGRMSQRVPC